MNYVKKGYNPWNKGKRGPSGEKIGTWKGDNVGDRGLHRWLRINWPNEFPRTCTIEGCTKPVYDLANINPRYDPKTYNRNFENWIPICRRHHMLHDGRMQRIMNWRDFPRMEQLRL